MKRWIEKLKDPSRDIYARRYDLMTVLSSAELVCLVIVMLISRFPPVPVVFYAGCAILNTMDYMTVKTGVSIQKTTVKGAIFFVFVYIPFGFFVGGGIAAGAVHWCIMAMAYIFLTVRYTPRNVLLVCDLIMTVVCFAVDYIRTDMVYEYTELQLFVSQIVLLIINLITLGAGFLFQVYTSDQERRLLERQRDELDALNRARVAASFTGHLQNTADALFAAAKPRVRISCDSGADLPIPWRREWEIAVIPHRVHTDSGTFIDGDEIVCDELMYYIRDGRHTARSEAPDVTAFEEFFAAQLKDADELVHISLADAASPAYAKAAEAARYFDRVTVVDSGSISGGTGMLVLYAAYLAKKTQMSAEEIAALIQRIKPQITARVLLEGTDYLVRGKRMQPLLGRWLDAFLMRPVLRMRNDKMSFFIAAGRYYRRHFIRGVINMRKRTIDPSLLLITYSGMTVDELRLVMEEAERCMHFDRVICMPTSSAIAINTGPGTFGLMFHKLSSDRETGARLFDFLD